MLNIKEIQEKIRALKKQKNAVILCHNYQRPEVQEIADYLGDSLDLSIKAKQVKEDIIIFCGVYFMAETAKILNPQKKVIIPEKLAGCPLAEMVTGDDIREYRKNNKDIIVVSYINTYADVKAESDIIVTSANALKIINTIDKNKKILFVPDYNLGTYIKKKCKRENMILWEGYCITHILVTTKDIIARKQEHPDAIVLAHPECREEVLNLCDEVLGTGGMIKYVKESKNKKFIIATEEGLVHRMKRENPDKEFILATKKLMCGNMKTTTIDKVYESLLNLTYEITIDEELAKRARIPIERMLSLV